MANEPGDDPINQLPSHISLLGVMLLGMIAVGCREDSGSDPIGVNVMYAFAPAGNISLSPDTDHIRPRGEMLLTVRGISKVTGSGEDRAADIEPGARRHGHHRLADPGHHPQPGSGGRYGSEEKDAALFLRCQPGVRDPLAYSHHQYRIPSFWSGGVHQLGVIPEIGRYYAAQSEVVKRYMKISSSTVFDTEGEAIELRP